MRTSNSIAPFAAQPHLREKILKSFTLAVLVGIIGLIGVDMLDSLLGIEIKSSGAGEWGRRLHDISLMCVGGLMWGTKSRRRQARG
jgi:hypothetical protein